MGFINIREASFIAIHSMMLIARHEDGLLNANLIAKELEVSEAHLSKILQSMVRAGLLTSSRGPKGGFSLSRPMEEITLLEIFKIFEGPAYADKNCPWCKNSCKFGKCPFGKISEYYNSEFLKELSSKTLADYVEGK